MEFTRCIGRQFLFYGIHEHLFKIDDYIFEAVEESNSYRSLLSEVRQDQSGLFYRDPLAIVNVIMMDEDGYRLVDEEYHHIWLSFGTDTTGIHLRYYFNYKPRPQLLKPKYPTRRTDDHQISSFDRLFDPRET